MTDKRTLAICLPHDQANQYQQMIVSDARKTAEKVGFAVAPYFGDGQAIVQVRQVYDCLRSAPLRLIDAIIAMPVTDNSLNRVAIDAVRAGLGWICLHRQMACLGDLRREFPALPISTVGPDQREIGRIQGRQFRALLPAGGRVLYVQGNAATSSARARLEGMKETISEAGIEIDLLEGNWSAEDAERTVTGWLRMVMSGKTRLDLIGCQNDEMAVGAKRAIDSVAAYLGRPEIAAIRITGCNGLPDFGRRWVNEGKMAATIIMPSSGVAAVELIAGARQMKPTPASLILPCVSYPDEKLLSGGAPR
ncbi:MAG: sugar ABC transporter substrate-binding protein, partial [Blastocatellia bacterium]